MNSCFQLLLCFVWVYRAVSYRKISCLFDWRCSYLAILMAEASLNSSVERPMKCSASPGACFFSGNERKQRLIIELRFATSWLPSRKRPVEIVLNFVWLKHFKVKLTDWLAENTKCGMIHPARQRKMAKLIFSAFSWSLSASSSLGNCWKRKKHETYLAQGNRWTKKDWLNF